MTAKDQMPALFSRVGGRRRFVGTGSVPLGFLIEQAATNRRPRTGQRSNGIPTSVAQSSRSALNACCCEGSTIVEKPGTT